ncbi:MAG: serine/threonine-protein kinase [Pirellulaceae bacterium]
MERFEQAWHRKPFPDLAEFLPDSTEGRLALLVELVAIDKEFRQTHHRPIDESEYVARFPELAQLDASATESRTESSSLTCDVSSITSTFSSPINRFRGGLGEVLIVYDQQLGRRVAVKQLQPRWKEVNRAVRAFQQEAELTSRLEHPGIVPVHGVGATPDGRPCYTMRYVEGETLAKRIASLRSTHSDFNLRCRPLLSSFITVCNTVAFAHSRGIIHRDLKPENIMLGAFGEALVIDWGLAFDIAKTDSKEPLIPSDSPNSIERDVYTRVPNDHPPANEGLLELTHRSRTTVDGEIMGTPAYLSPEQALGENDSVSTSIDIFGLGAILYAILTGVPPYQAANAGQSLELAARHSWKTPRERDRSIPIGLDAICRRAMARYPADRHATAELLAREVDNWLCGEPIDSMPDPWNRRLSRLLRKRRTLAGMLASGLGVVVFATPLVVAMVSRERAQKQAADRIAAFRAESTEQVTEYLAKIFKTIDPIRSDDPGFVGPENLDTQQTFRRMLEVGYELVGTELREQPALRSQILRSIGDSLRGVGEYDRAQSALLESLALSQQVVGNSGEETLACEYALALLDYDRGNYAEAESRLPSHRWSPTVVAATATTSR